MIADDRPTLITWVLTIAECIFGAWLSLSGGYPTLGGVFIGLALGTQFSRVVRQIVDARAA